MKSSYKKEAWYLSNNKLIHGYKDKYGFHPDKNIKSECDTQHITKKDYDKTIFYKLTTPSIKGLNNLELIGGKLIFAIDDGRALTKVMCNVGKSDYQYSTNRIILSEKRDIEEIRRLILKVLESLGIKSYKNTKIYYKLTSESAYITKRCKHIHSIEIQHSLPGTARTICTFDNFDTGGLTVDKFMAVEKLGL